MDAAPALLGALLGAGILLAFMGVRTLTNNTYEDDRRKKGYWPLNVGLFLAAFSMYMMAAGV